MLNLYRKIKVCYYHPIREATEICPECQKLICKYCVCIRNDVAYCPDCAQKKRSSFFKLNNR